MEGTTHENPTEEVNSDTNFAEETPQESADVVFVSEEHIKDDENHPLEETEQPMEGQEQYYEEQQQKEYEGSIVLSVKDPLETAVENADLISESFAENEVNSVESELMPPKLDVIHVEECDEHEVEEGTELIEDTNAVVELPNDELEANSSMDSIDYEYGVDQTATIVDKESEQIIIQEVNDEVSEEEIEIQTYTEDSVDDGEVVRGGSKSENLKLASSCTVQVEDGGTVQIELYKTTDETKKGKESFKKAKVAASAPKPTPPNKTPKQRKTRKSTYDIPMHVLGVDINKPIESANNGRAIPKPRIGVKVPYRNLTSQIVTKAEIEDEIMERSRQKQAQEKVASSFAKSLTQRLAKKIVSYDENEEEEDADLDEAKEAEETDDKDGEKDDKISNDSDLLAILEGEGDEMPMLPKEVPAPQDDETTLKALEREIALQQLQELPSQEPKPRIFKSRLVKAPILSAEAKQKESTLTKSVSTPEVGKKTTTVFRKAVSTPEGSSKTKDPLIKSRPNEKNSSGSSTGKENTTKPTPKKDYSVNLSPHKKSPIEIEPQVKVNMVLKTYSRKRKTSEPKDEMDEEMFKKSTPEDNIKQEESIDLKAASPDVYITKSSRVIKKKVIWDPAEAQPRSPRLSVKSEPAKTPPSKVAKSADKNANTEVVVDKTEKEKPAAKKVTPPEKRPKLVVSKVTKIPAKTKLSEVDRLLMDEGAVKMLYELNNDDRVVKPKKEFYDIEKVAKDIKKKANLLKNELEQTASDNQKSLRNREGTPSKSATITERKMSKDSTKSSINTPPSSPFPQGSMLIRRRSSSSISSSDDTEVEEGAARASRKKTESVKKEKKVAEDTAEAAAENARSNRLSNQYKSFTVRKTGKHVAIDLHYIDDKCYFTVQVLDELISVLQKFASEKDCLVVTLSSSNEAFCLGVEYSQLVSDEETERTEKAIELADKVREFMLCLLHFPKILIACIQGKCLGLGVTMLPLFDMVLATDKATFETPYLKMGCMSEAGFLLSYPFSMNHGLATELLYLGQKLTADDASKRGLVKLCWPEKFKIEIKNVVAAILKGSKQSLESIKQQLRGASSEQAEAAITKESEMLVEQWISPECQSAFSSL